jgi:hypothetical protein
MHAAIGSRVKFLVDTPEALWGLLDSKQPLVAARRLRAALLVHTRLREERAQALTRQFPLLRNRWAAATSKQQDILSCANDMLRTTARIDKVGLWLPLPVSQNVAASLLQTAPHHIRKRRCQCCQHLP